jgi:hypothetical protein
MNRNRLYLPRENSAFAPWPTVVLRTLRPANLCRTIARGLGRTFLSGPGAFTLLFVLIFFVNPAWATQTHREPEGLVVHQLSHVFFIVSMGTLAYWLRARNLTESQGWRYIRYSALLLILWNLDALTAHFFDEQFGAFRLLPGDKWHLIITTRPGAVGLDWLYYAVKLDHLLCVPALVFLYLGLRRLYRDNALPNEGDRP